MDFVECLFVDFSRQKPDAYSISNINSIAEKCDPFSSLDKQLCDMYYNAFTATIHRFVTQTSPNSCTGQQP